MEEEEDIYMGWRRRIYWYSSDTIDTFENKGLRVSDAEEV
jgi:hypothetical protein